MARAAMLANKSRSLKETFRETEPLVIADRERR
jgi:hypothetical protein